MAMIRIGEYNELRMYKRVDFGVYLGDEDNRILLPRKWVPEGVNVGDSIRVFVYTDSEDRPIATTMVPLATVGEFASMEVVDVTEHGAFVNCGLEKDLFVPIVRQMQPLRKGQRRVVYVSLHERTQRLIGSTDIGRFFDSDIDALDAGQEVPLLVFDFNDVGALVVVAGRYRGIVYHDETFQPLELGQALTGWVKTLREDNRVDISLQRIGHGSTLDAKEVVLRALADAGGKLPLHDKSSPEEIRTTLKLSKKVFKKAIGGLYKERRILINDAGIEAKATD
jgi:predicted RNA-binding protein (virulence factor B family)